MSLRKQDTKWHNCKLPEDTDEVITYFIETGCFVKLRRFLKSYTMVSYKHPMAHSYLSSINNIRNEQRKHLTRHYHMIHPYSMGNFYYRIFITFNLSLFCFFWPTISTVLDFATKYYIFAFPNLTLCSLVFTSFFTGYHDSNIHHVVMKQRKVTLHYLFTYFVFDIIALGPFCNKTLICLGIINKRHEDMAWSKMLSYFMPLAKFARFPYMLETVNEMKLYYNFNNYKFQACKIFLCFIFAILLVNSLVYFVMEINPNIRQTYVRCLTITMETLLLVTGDFESSDLVMERIYPVILIIVGFMLHLVLFSFVSQLLEQYISTRTKQKLMYKSLKAYMRQRGLPERTRNRILLYVDYKFQGSFYKESYIKRVTTKGLRQEVIAATAKLNTDKVELFNKIPDRIMTRLRSCMIDELYLPGDLIVKTGAIGTCMFFIIAGTAEVKINDDKHVCYLRDGDYFGEVALVVHIARIADVRAVTPMEVFRLKRIDFVAIMEKYPELMQEVAETAMKRLEVVREITDADNPENVVIKLHEKDELDFELVGEDDFEDIKTEDEQETEF